MEEVANAIQREKYFEYRNVATPTGAPYTLPAYLVKILPADKNAAILDIGCGFGYMLRALRDRGYTNITGVDIARASINACREQNIPAMRIENIIAFAETARSTYDFIIMSHVLEHIEKENTIHTLRVVRKQLLSPGGQVLIMVPNAQSHTGAYWAYEDFTHKTIFTAGSLQYALRAAGFRTIAFLDCDCTAGLSFPTKMIRKFFLMLYKIQVQFWNKITGSSYHKYSPQIFSYELKVLVQ